MLNMIDIFIHIRIVCIINIDPIDIGWVKNGVIIDIVNIILVNFIQ